MYSAALFQRNEKKKAQEALSALVSIAPDYEPPAKHFSKPFILWKAQMTSQPKPLGGNLSIQSSPAGARVFIDGKEVGHTPLTLDMLSRGFHLMRLERPGFTTHGEFVQLYAADATLSVELKPTTKYKAFDALAQEISDDVMRGKSSAALGRLGKTLGLDRVLMGVLKQTDNSGTTELTLGIFDAANDGKQLAFRRTSIVGLEYGELKSELSRVATSLLVAAEGRPLASKRKPDDPLEGKSGLEEWGGEDRGGRVEEKTKRPSQKDPLDSVSGMEDW
jgi:hypothetical protein